MRRVTRNQRSISGLLTDEGGWLSLLALLMTIVIIAILTVMFLGGTPTTTGGGTGGGSTGLGGAGGALAAKEYAQREPCRNNLQQIRYAIQMFQSGGEGSPQSLDQLVQNNPSLQLKCPAGDEPYQYDPQAGRVSCTHAGHTRL